METETRTTRSTSPSGTREPIELRASAFPGHFVIRRGAGGENALHLSRAELQDLLDQAMDVHDMTAQPFRTVAVPA